MTRLPTAAITASLMGLLALLFVDDFYLLAIPVTGLALSVVVPGDGEAGVDRAMSDRA